MWTTASDRIGSIFTLSRDELGVYGQKPEKAEGQALERVWRGQHGFQFNQVKGKLMLRSDKK